jgi:hypothetical protein
MMMLLGCGSSGSGVSVSDEVAQFFDRLAPEPDTALRADYITFIDGCVAAGIWTSLKCALALAVSHEGQAVTDLVTNRIANPEPGHGGTLTWTADRGYLTDGLNRLSTEFDPSADAPFQDSGFVAFYSLTSGQINMPALVMGQSGSVTSNDKISIYPKWSTNNVEGTIANSSTYIIVATADNSDGWFIMNRSAPNAFSLRRNTTQKGTSSAASSAYTAGEKVKLRCHHQTAFFVAGSSLSGAQHDALYALVVAFLTSRGAI